MYITALKTISPQPTYDESFFNGNYTFHSGNKYRALEPDYTGIIGPNLLRRMGKSIRIGIGAGFPLIQNRKDVDAIIIASSEGGQEDSIKFLNQIVGYNEGTLTPTNFLQSTPNALAGSLALMSQNTCYNITHVHKGHAFENSLIDAFLLFNRGKANTILAGNVEEISDYNFNIESLAGKYKTEETTSENLLASNTSGTVCGEGSSMFILEKNATSYYSRIVDVEQISFPTEDEIYELVKNILEKNQLKPADIDVLILGNNGDKRNDFWYTALTRRIFQNQSICTFKNLIGEYPSSIAFATFLGAWLISGKIVNLETMKLPKKPIKHILIYNHYNGEQHGLILMSS
jgi:3-oxoacyl-(acyl-carrier-protein) synthase